MIIYRLVQRTSNPRVADAPLKFYPTLLSLNRTANLNYIAEKIRDQSSLPIGDIKGMLQNFVEKIKEQLLEGKTVNIEGLGVFRLSAKSKGTDTAEDFDDTAIESVRICFSASKSLRLSRNATRASERLEFVNIDDYIASLGVTNTEGDAAEDNGTNTSGGGNNTGGDIDGES